MRSCAAAGGRRAAHGKLRIRLFLPSNALMRHASWLYSQIFSSASSTRMNLPSGEAWARERHARGTARFEADTLDDPLQQLSGRATSGTARVEQRRRCSNTKSSARGNKRGSGLRGEAFRLKTTISHPSDRARAAQKMAMLRATRAAPQPRPGRLGWGDGRHAREGLSKSPRRTCAGAMARNTRRSQRRGERGGA